MKILVVCQHFYPEQFRINDICLELVKRGHKITVLTGLPNYPKGKVFSDYRWFRKRKEKVNGITIIRSSLIGRGKTQIRMVINYMSFAICASIKAFFMKKDFDVIYVYQLSPITMVWPAIVIKKLKKIPLIIHCLDQWPVSVTAGGFKDDSIVYKILYNWSRYAYLNADTITISSKSFSKYFENDLKIYALEKGLIYCPSYAESNYSNSKLIKNDKFDIVFAGNIGPAQSVETIIEAANLLKECKSILFHIVGDGLSKSKCESLTKKYKLQNVKFHGYHNVEKMDKYYDLADAFIITMLDNEVVNSTLPAKIQSYMAAGKPIIGAVNGEARMIIEDSDCGLCCESLNYQKLAELIIKMKDDKKMYKVWSKNSLEYYQKHFSKNIIISKMESILNDVVKDNKSK